MSETPQSEPESGGYLRLPLPVVAIGLFVVLAVLLALGLYANANLRSPGVIVPTPVAAATPPPPATQAPAAQGPLSTPVPATPAVVARTTPTPVETISAVIAGTPQASASSTSAPTLSERSPTQPNRTSTPSPTVSPELAAEVGDAYQAYWQVRAQALYDLDTSHLQEVMSGDHLAAAQGLVSQLRNEGRAIQTNVSHNSIVVSASNTDAKVADEYVDNSVYIDVNSRDNLSQPTGATVREEYDMMKQDGAWRVVSLLRDSS